MTDYSKDELYVHALIRYQLNEADLLEREKSIRKLDPYSPEHQSINDALDSLYTLRTNDMKVCDAISFELYDLYRNQVQRTNYAQFFVDNYFLIVGNVINIWGVADLNPDGSCSREIRINQNVA